MESILKKIENSPMMDIVEQEYSKRFKLKLEKGEMDMFKLSTCIIYLAEKKGGVSGKFTSEMMKYNLSLFQSKDIKQEMQKLWFAEAFAPDVGKLRKNLSEYYLKVSYYLITLLSTVSAGETDIKEEDLDKFTMFVATLMAQEGDCNNI